MVDVWDRHSSSLFNLENPYKGKYSAYYDLRIREIFIVYSVKVNLHGSEKSPRFSLRRERKKVRDLMNFYLQEVNNIKEKGFVEGLH